MPTNEFIPVVFNDGEPLDPTKLNNLVKNINNIYQTSAISLSNSTMGDGTTPQVPIIFTFRHKFENVKAGTPQSFPFNFGNKFDSKDVAAGKVYVATGVKSSITDTDVVMASVGGVTTGAPTLFVNFSGKGTRTIYVDVIAICMKDIV